MAARHESSCIFFDGDSGDSDFDRQFVTRLFPCREPVGIDSLQVVDFRAVDGRVERLKQSETSRPEAQGCLTCVFRN